MNLPVLRCATWLVMAIAFAGSGCAHSQRNCVPKELVRSEPTVDLNAPPGEDHAIDRDIVNQLLNRDTSDADLPPGAKRYQILAMSGGGAFGAYTAGVLNGWTAAGDRPCFDIVTGISTGGLIATLAFVGSSQDRTLCEMYTQVSSSDIYTMRPTVSLLWSESAASSAPLKKLIDRQITPEIVNQVACAHAQGRRLYIGTTNLDARKLVVWDMGALASSQRPDRVELYRKVVLASASVPGFFPPVCIDVTVNGQRFTEMHGDGAATSQVFIPGAALKIDRELLRQGKKPLAGSQVYVVLAGKLYADPDCVEPKIKSIAGSALSSLTYAETRVDMIRIWSLCKMGGMGYQSTAIPQDLELPGDPLEFDPVPMGKMYQAGICDGRDRRRWRTTPPGSEPSEQLVPRAGTEFVTPVIQVPSCPPGR
ncbi:MAG: patatin-like phospholipase family protein [Gemmataceae bacterium]|nr:patatin-like phospholipase family protein [Gemmataceae bacterium]